MFHRFKSKIEVSLTQTFPYIVFWKYINLNQIYYLHFLCYFEKFCSAEGNHFSFINPLLCDLLLVLFLVLIWGLVDGVFNTLTYWALLQQVLGFWYPKMLISCWSTSIIRDRFTLFRSTWRNLCFWSRDIGSLTLGKSFKFNSDPQRMC